MGGYERYAPYDMSFSVLETNLLTALRSTFVDLPHAHKATSRWRYIVTLMINASFLSAYSIVISSTTLKVDSDKFKVLNFADPLVVFGQRIRQRNNTNHRCYSLR